MKFFALKDQPIVNRVSEELDVNVHTDSLVENYKVFLKLLDKIEELERRLVRYERYENRVDSIEYQVEKLEQKV